MTDKTLKELLEERRYEDGHGVLFGPLTNDAVYELVRRLHKLDELHVLEPEWRGPEEIAQGTKLACVCCERFPCRHRRILDGGMA